MSTGDDEVASLRGVNAKLKEVVTELGDYVNRAVLNGAKALKKLVKQTALEKE